ncbi:MAG: bifunctional phosphopantothenoylcysteine decarboxylase/phosphopantothenate--cysteine ligase CoaBC [Cyanobacteria bacterium HKST-UBA04]|nr:bifunctional phosphopantothenoylcysteine decarboxylase/phosphopantothenate--cysteine ligase CoaBC [Cyanobacteria bacterium HKST-UBA04]
MSVFSNLNILVAVTGGIAAYKACDVIRQCQKLGAHRVKALLSPSAAKFVTPLTFESLTREAVMIDPFENDAHGTPTHIAAAQQFDVMVIVPATANTLAKLAGGLADNILTTTALTFTHKPVVVAPAANTRMWQNPATQRNIALLEAYGNYTIVPPDTGDLACGESGEGKLAPLDTLLLYIQQATHPYAGLLKGQRIVISAGGTQQPLDPVRYLGNHSSGKMGVALADECFAMGADVVLVHAQPGSLQRPYPIHHTPTVQAMADAVSQAFATATGLIMAAAVSDYAPDQVAGHKLKKSGNQALTLTLTPTIDILKTMSATKTADQWTVGFAAETNDLAQNAQTKLVAKGCDMLVVNDVSRSDIGMGSDHNEVTLYLPNHEAILVPKTSKSLIARQLLLRLAQHVLSKPLVTTP